MEYIKNIKHLCVVCYLLDGISKGAWLNRSSIIYAGNDKWSGDPRVSIVSNVGDKHEYSLQIQKVDVTDEGLYTCSIQSERNLRPKLIQLIVKVPPKIYDISSDITVNEGSNVSLICTASGKPEPKISWRHITPSARKYESGEYLNITGITRDQAGDYECGAENDIASPDTKTVRVTVNFPPAIHEMKSHGVRPGQIALLRCEAAAVPSPVFEWYKGEKRINMGQGIDIKNLSSRSVLTVKNMTQDRYGNYTCVAVNRLGTANASVPLIPLPLRSHGLYPSNKAHTHIDLQCLWQRTNHAALKEKLIRPCGVTANPSRQGADPSLLAFVFTLLPNSPGKKDQKQTHTKCQRPAHPEKMADLCSKTVSLKVTRDICGGHDSFVVAGSSLPW
ncbi:hypothetical protein ABG768_024146 [Culter alburnus]|uniref:Neuronal growth regulator 1 n=1 Tax=Culter alburnus TaxID=194366 RepID=A0AAW2AI87_CULAL